MFIKKIFCLAHDFQSRRKETLPFEDQALHILNEYNFDDVFSQEELIEYSKTEEAKKIKVYKNNEFGEYPITIFSNNDFFIDAYIWNEHDTAVHDHNFVGAFKMLKGSTLHFTYLFEAEKKDDTCDLEYGNLVLNEQKILKPNDCEKIMFKNKFIHRAVHLEKPTITLCLRTHFLTSFNSLYHPFRLRGTYHLQNISELASSLSKMKSSQIENKLKTLDPMTLWALRTVIVRSGQNSKKSKKTEFICETSLALLKKEFDIDLRLLPRSFIKHGMLKNILHE